MGVNLGSAGLAAAGSLSICYPLDFARTRLASDVGGGKKTFNGIGDCIRKTAKQSGVMGLYNGFGASVGGVVVYRGLQMGVMDTIMGPPLSEGQGHHGARLLLLCRAGRRHSGSSLSTTP